MTGTNTSTEDEGYDFDSMFGRKQCGVENWALSDVVGSAAMVVDVVLLHQKRALSIACHKCS